MDHNKEAKSLTFWRGSEVSQVKDSPVSYRIFQACFVMVLLRTRYCLWLSLVWYYLELGIVLWLSLGFRGLES